jgi:hypothetical protein
MSCGIRAMREGGQGSATHLRPPFYLLVQRYCLEQSNRARPKHLKRSPDHQEVAEAWFDAVQAQ